MSLLIRSALAQLQMEPKHTRATARVTLHSILTPSAAARQVSGAPPASWLMLTYIFVPLEVVQEASLRPSGLVEQTLVFCLALAVVLTPTYVLSPALSTPPPHTHPRAHVIWTEDCDVISVLLGDNHMRSWVFISLTRW